MSSKFAAIIVTTAAAADVGKNNFVWLLDWQCMCLKWVGGNLWLEHWHLFEPVMVRNCFDEVPFDLSHPLIQAFSLDEVPSKRNMISLRFQTFFFFVFSFLFRCVSISNYLIKKVFLMDLKFLAYYYTSSYAKAIPVRNNY